MDPSAAKMAQLIKDYIDELRSVSGMPPKRIAALLALENSIRPLLPLEEDADQTQQNPVTTEPATSPATVTTTTSVGEINQAYVSALFDVYDLKEIDPDSYQIILQKVNDEFTINSLSATLDDIANIGLTILENNYALLIEVGDPRAKKLEVIISELKQYV